MQRELNFERRPNKPSLAPRRLPTLRAEYEAARFIAQFHPQARLREANRELLQQRRHD